MLVSAGRFFFFSSCTREPTRTLRSIRLVVDAHCRARYLTAIRSFVLPQEFSPFPSLCSSPFLSLLLSLSLHECRLPLLFNVYPLSSYLGALLIGLSSVLTMILAREHRYDRTTRSSYRRAMRPDALLLRKPNWPAFKKGVLTLLLSLSLPLPLFLLFFIFPFYILFSLFRPKIARLLRSSLPSFQRTILRFERNVCANETGRCPRVAPSCYPFEGMKIPINELCLTAKGITYLSRFFPVSRVWFDWLTSSFSSCN